MLQTYHFPFQKVRYEIELFIKVEYLVKTFKKYVLKKIEFLANTYKSGGLSGKLLKMTKYIYIGVYCENIVIKIDTDFNLNILLKLFFPLSKKIIFFHQY